MAAVKRAFMKIHIRDFAGEHKFGDPYFGPARRENGIEIRGCIDEWAVYLSCSNRGCPSNNGGFGGRCLEEPASGVPKELLRRAEKEIRKMKKAE